MDTRDTQTTTEITTDLTPSECNLVPVCDMLNHRDEGSEGLKTVFHEAHGDIHGVCIKAGRFMAEQQEIVATYDPYKVRGNSSIAKACVQVSIMVMCRLKEHECLFSTWLEDDWALGGSS